MKRYTHVMLKTGESACIVEVLDDGKAYIADVDHDDGGTTTDFITQDQIDKEIDCAVYGKQFNSIDSSL